MNDLLVKVELSHQKLRKRLEEADFYGCEMFDGLSSPFFNNALFNSSKFLRLCATQFFKRFPWNLRPIFSIPKTQDIKGLALSLKSYVLLENIEKCDYLYSLIMRKKLNNKYYWGYTWPYQLVAFNIPKDHPNIIATGFILDALLDLYEKHPTEELKNNIRLTADCIVKEFYLTDKEYFAYFSGSDFGVYNAISIASYLLYRVEDVLNITGYEQYAISAIDYVINKQNSDGSWYYGDLSNQRFIDHFHTIYNLQCMYYIAKSRNSSKCQLSFDKGYDFYINNLFSEDNLPKYFNNSLHPLDIHCFASAIIFLTQLKVENDKLDSIINYVIDCMQKANGDFVYRIERFWRNENVYIRWCNAWMFYAFSCYLKASK